MSFISLSAGFSRANNSCCRLNSASSVARRLAISAPAAISSQVAGGGLQVDLEFVELRLNIFLFARRLGRRQLFAQVPDVTFQFRLQLDE